MPSLRVTGACHVEGTPSVGTGPRRGGRSPWSVRGSEQRFWTGQRGPMGPTGGRGPAAGTGHGGRWPHTRRRRSMVGTGRAKAAAGTGLKRTEARARTWRQAMEQRTGHAPRTGAARDRGGLAPEHAGTETEQKTEPDHDEGGKHEFRHFRRHAVSSLPLHASSTEPRWLRSGRHPLVTPRWHPAQILPPLSGHVFLALLFTNLKRFVPQGERFAKHGSRDATAQPSREPRRHVTPPFDIA